MCLLSIPQVLYSMGLIKYKQTLKDKLAKKEIVSSEEECEIRAASIISCEKLRVWLGCCNSVELDFYLWVIIIMESHCVYIGFDILGIFSKN